ncbi:putative transcriptional regulator [Gordonia araii NBRC 100433]|uniref:Putative transcriptional regulator n=1 Tax=Gordonia araii NBRC 100433 TaxID=1073574 RepID=G7H2V6_9ACTN|nr:TetR/AcrR family transcriptional regulator [Gordonia araii]NNG98335.1 TetR/AcrR family transcriptional regulator [Gordonia araii NBRC 100433]GAB10181.1 putative transcriptional regulator [Gordonia araii NBRC 100433]
MAEERRRTRANGEASRSRILDAATEIAGERGYDGTSIALVSKRCGLPASSIYWHFANKDDLIAAVIDRSFGRWLGAWTIPDGGSVRQRLIDATLQVGRAQAEAPDFLRLGLMLALERRPVEARAREVFLRVRATALDAVRGALADNFPELDDQALDHLAVYAMAGADGLFIAREISDGDGSDVHEPDAHGVDMHWLFELHAHALVALIERLLPPR